ncbi:hypothetical protein PACTADRAFT_50344 [Pachysolen tannophilus NRRL Y-2460]|uniref:Signal peptidase complex subunit 2 n=1 Tax=Pachysolen tannophilus NRRL Y-2460 TaxID=669874 RepID=A0A1E4TV85_PACTA|nr:hypothetical protein PACTADRAFT_50344 [Pachysolen tannophilus NRRL Y-2460]
MVEGQKKINLNSVYDLKTNCDDNLSNFFESIGYSQDFHVIDIRLALTYTSIFLSALLFYLEKKFKNDFKNEEYYWYMIYVIASFYVISGINWIYIKFVEHNIKYMGKNEITGDKITVATIVEKKNIPPTYKITITLNDKDKKVSSKPFTELYEETGFLNYDLFKKFLNDDYIEVLNKKKN